MIKHGVFFCKYCKYRCPVPLPVNDLQRDVGVLDHLFTEMVESWLGS